MLGNPSKQRIWEVSEKKAGKVAVEIIATDAESMISRLKEKYLKNAQTIVSRSLKF